MRKIGFPLILLIALVIASTGIVYSTVGSITSLINPKATSKQYQKILVVSAFPDLKEKLEMEKQLFKELRKKADIRTCIRESELLDHKKNRSSQPIEELLTQNGIDAILMVGPSCPSIDTRTLQDAGLTASIANLFQNQVTASPPVTSTEIALHKPTSPYAAALLSYGAGTSMLTWTMQLSATLIKSPAVVIVNQMIIDGVIPAK